KHSDEIFKPLALEIEHALAEWRQLVIAAPGIVELGRRAVTRFDDQSFLDETFQRTVQRGRPEPHLTVAALQHVLHDAVAVLLRSHQGEQNVQPIALEWQERLPRLSLHALICISTHMHIGQETMRRERRGCGLLPARAPSCPALQRPTRSPPPRRRPSCRLLRPRSDRPIAQRDRALVARQADRRPRISRPSRRVTRPRLSDERPAGRSGYQSTTALSRDPRDVAPPRPTARTSPGGRRRSTRRRHRGSGAALRAPTRD